MLKDLILKNKTYRRFDESYQVPYSLLEQWIETLRFIPTARNQQALKYLIVTDPQLREKIFPHLAWAGYLKDWPGPEKGERPTAYIIISIDNKISDNYIAHWTLVDLGIAIQTILLSAAENDLGGCVIVAFNKKQLRNTLQIPDFLDLQAVLAIGKPVENIIQFTMDKNSSDIKYFRDENGNHYVPKRPLHEILLNKWDNFKHIH